MHIVDIVRKKQEAGKPVFSVEIIPPRNGGLLSRTLKRIESLSDVKPDFVSITRGAGGSLRGGTVPIAYLIKQRFGIETVAHLTCIDTSIEELENSLIDHWYLGIENILALRGDPPRDAIPQYKEFRGLHYHTYARDLVRQIHRMNEGKYLLRTSDSPDGIDVEGGEFRKGTPTGFSVVVAGHPEGHPECPDREEAIRHLKEKVDAGADLIITQMVFSAEVYRDFVRRARDIGVTIPIIPGVRPITRADQIPSIENFFSVTVDPKFSKELLPLNEEQAKERGIQLTCEVCRDLLAAGAPGIHFYIMNDVNAGKRLIGLLEH